MNLVVALIAALPLASSTFVPVNQTRGKLPQPPAPAIHTQPPAARSLVVPALFEAKRCDVRANSLTPDPSSLAATFQPPLSPAAANDTAYGGGALRAGLCDDPIYVTSEADGVNGISSERGGDGVDSFGAEDANLSEATLVGAIHWQALVSPDYADSTVDVLILPDEDGLPDRDDSHALRNISDASACRIDSGEQLFGYPVIQYSYFPTDLTIPAGTTWFALRPVSGSGGGRAFWPTANTGIPIDHQAAFRSYSFGYNGWFTIEEILGTPSDLVFCLTGVPAGGACCLDGDCSETSKSDCDKRGGEFNDAVPCCAVICRNRAAACCFEDGTCENLKREACEAAGGIFQGEETLRGPGVCPLPDFCENAIYSQFGYDGDDALSAQDSSDIGWIDSEVADDAPFSSAVEITGAVWQTIDRGEPDVTVGDYAVYYRSQSGGPGRLISSGDNIAFDARVTDGTMQFVGVVWVYKISMPSIRAVPGDVYVSLRPRIETPVQSFWLTAPGGNDPGYFRSKYHGHPNWTRTSEVLGVDVDFSFCLLGTQAAAHFGACCLDDESRCELLTSSECDSAGGSYYGDNTPCIPSPCSNAPGACCFLDPFGCDDTLSKAECESSGGEFQGGATECAQTYCPLPDFCENAIYSQFGYDGENGFSNQDTSSINWIDSMCADDVVAENFFEISSIVIQSLDRGDPVVDVIDYSIFATHPQGGPGREIRVGDNVTTFKRAGDGTKLFGGLIWTYVADIAPTKTVPGQYWFNVRPVINDYVQAFWLTAPGNGNASYFRSEIFGIPNWTPADSDGGYPYELSFCVTGAVTDPFGACCIDNESVCVPVSDGECASQGGVYFGEGSSCFPSPCANAPGACCFLDPFGCEDSASKADCESRGGVFQGGDTLCAGWHCPLPDYCQDSYYSQFGSNGMSTYFNADATIFGFEYWTADDFTADHRIELTAFVTQSTDYSFGGDLNGIEAFQYAVWASTARGPGKELASGTSTSFARITDGSLLFGKYVIYQNRVTLNGAVRLVPGDYYISARPVINGNFYSYFASADGGGQSGYNRYNGGEWSEIGQDFSFCVIASKSDDLFGACCTDNETTCTILTHAECDGAGGRYAGDNATCFPNPCENATGACCFESGECSKMSPLECAAGDGSFQGGDVECATGLCPIPDPCDGLHGEVLYNNSAMDGENALLSMDGRDSFGFEIYCADDASFDKNVTIGGLHWYEWAVPGITVDGGDYLIIADNGGSPLGGDEVVNVEDTSLVRFATGEKMFGYYDVYQNNFKGLSVPLAAGTYWFGMRVNVTNFDYAYWPTAPRVGNRLHVRSEALGCPDWCEGDDSDLAYCLTAAPAPCGGIARGDSDGSAAVDFNDIDCFVAALISPEDWEACGTALSGAGAYMCANDTDQNGSVDFNDIDSFIQCIIDGGCP